VNPDTDNPAPLDHRATGPQSRRLLEVTGAFLILGLISFGGPVAHLGYLREEFVGKRRWLEDAAYGDLVALCQFLPGPASSQVVFALGMQRAGWLGGLLASLCFTLPSAVLMIAFGYGVATMGDLHSAGWLHGLKLAAVAVVAQAVWGMGRNLCPDRARLTIGSAAAALLLLFPGALVQVGVIFGGGAIGWWLYRKAIPRSERAGPADWRHHLVAGGLLAAYLLLLLLLPVLAATTGRKDIAVFDSFYRAGSLVFGGGHVILPLLRAEVVPNGWVADDTFLAGYGAAQALPGPLFTFAGYLGTAIHSGPKAWMSGLWCLFAIFLPALLLIAGALPFWHQLRAKTWTQAALRGANAAVVGVLLAALYNPVWKEGVRNTPDVAAVVVAFGLLQCWMLPPWLVVLLAAVTGQWLLS
jgi:chromate transporter